MTYTLSNDLLTVSIQDAGAQLCSVRSAGGTEPTPPSGAGMPRCYSP